MSKIVVKFPKGIETVRIPFLPDIGSFDQLFKQIERVKYPKITRRLEAHLVLSIDLAEGETSYQMGEVRVIK